MSHATSPSAGQVYGVERVCRVWGVPRSTVYDHRTRLAEGRELGKRGPKPVVPDEELLGRVQADLEASPFVGEGHRKVYHRLQWAGVKAGRERVLRLMRENNLLSPYRTPQGTPEDHDGRIVTDRPNEMWGTDGARFQTVEDGWVWGFFAVDHFNSECVGWHVSKWGTRFAALEPIAMGLNEHFGSSEAGAGATLALRMDHGTQYTSEDFRQQLKAWGIRPSFAYVAEPETNGVAERFIRTLKEQVIYGRIYRNLEELRSAIAAFIERYNSRWLVERLAYRSPRQARQEALALAA